MPTRNGVPTLSDLLTQAGGLADFQEKQNEFSKEQALKQLLQKNEIGATRSNLEFSQGQENNRQQAGFTHADKSQQAGFQHEDSTHQAQFAHDKAMNDLHQQYQKELLDLQTKADIYKHKTGAQIDLSKEKAVLADKYSQAMKAIKENPNAIVEGGGVKIDTMTPAIKAGQEAQQVSSDYEKMVKPESEELKDIDDALGTLHNKDAPLTKDSLRVSMARMLAKGRINQAEFSSIMKPSLEGMLRGAVNWAAPETASKLGIGEILSPNQVSNYEAMLQQKKADAQKRLEANRNELSTRAGVIAPVLNSQGNLDKVMGGLGTANRGYNNLQQPPAAVPTSIPSTGMSGPQAPPPSIQPPTDPKARLEYLRKKAAGQVN